MLEILLFPCNQFGKQEPGTSDEIQEFCQVNYGVDFLITEKVDVKGNDQHPLYSWLTQKSENGKNEARRLKQEVIDLNNKLKNEDVELLDGHHPLH